LTTAGQVATLFLMMAIGFALRKWRKLSDDGISPMTFLLLYVVAPCLIVRSMQIERSAEALQSMLFSALGCVIYYVVGIVGGLPLFSKRAPDTRDVLRFGSVYSNNGFMGFPLVLALLGDGAGICAAAFLIVNSIVQWTHGVALMTPKNADAATGSRVTNLRRVVLNPGTIAFAIGAVLYGFGLRLPQQVGNAVGFMADVNTPLAMVIIGAQMADADILSLFRHIELYALAALKLLIFPAIAAAILHLFSPPPLVYCATVILAATPSAGMTSMFAQRFGRDTATAARAVTFTTLLSILTLPVFASVAMRVSGL
jgi:predicted permease